MEIASITLCEAAKGLASGSFSSVELTRALLDEISRRDVSIQAYLTVDAEGALRMAQAADAARAAGLRGDLLGVPVAVKDLINVDGQPLYVRVENIVRLHGDLRRDGRGAVAGGGRGVRGAHEHG
jgi:Asp-tRNA(Asn)/Glu-tRNA(Gln) amidotransferase A subunit family amidase